MDKKVVLKTLNGVLCAVLPSLGKDKIGYIVSLFSATKSIEEIKQFISCCGDATAAINLLKEAFGEDVASFLKPDENNLSFDDVSESYHKEDLGSASNNQEVALKLKRELDLNLKKATNSGVVDYNVLRGVFFEWSLRYKQFIVPMNYSEKRIFKVIDSIQDGSSRSLLGVFWKLIRAGIGFSGFGVLVFGILASIGVGAGLWSSVVISLFGIPWLNIFILFVAGFMMIVVSFVSKVNSRNAVNISTSMAYVMCKRRYEPEGRYWDMFRTFW